MHNHGVDYITTIINSNKSPDFHRHHVLFSLPKLLFLGMCIVALMVGCKSTPKKSPMMKQLKVKDITSQELQIRVYEFASHFSHVVEASADEIRNQTSDSTIRRQALIWKIYAVPECQAAATAADPFMAFIDTWTFTEQMADYFETGKGKDIFGELQPIAIDTSRSLETQIVNMMKDRALLERFEKAQIFVNDWVREHPIKTHFYTRDSTLPLLTEIFKAGPKGTFATVGGLDQNIQDISDRIAYLTDAMPRQARWQAEYFLENTVSGEQLEETLNSVSTMVDSVDRLTRFVERSEEIIDRERVATFVAIQAEREAVMKSVGEQRIATLQELRKDLATIIEALQQERIALVGELKNERIETMEVVEAITARTVEDVSERIDGLVEALFWRASLMLAGLVGVGLILGAIMMRLMARRGLSTPNPSGS